MSRSRIISFELSAINVFRMMYFYSIVLIIIGFYLSPLQEILSGLLRIILTPSVLLTDYFALGGIGATLINSGTLMFLSVLLGQKSKTAMNGSLIAATFTVGGFAFLGKNIYNVSSIVLGVYLYSLIKKERFSKCIAVALYGTALAPVISQISFGMGINPFLSILLGNITGIMIGLILPPLAAGFANFHKGFNLYNIGFTAGVVGMIIMSVFRAVGYNHQTVLNVTDKTNIYIVLFLAFYFTSMCLSGIILCKNDYSGYARLLGRNIKTSTDFVDLDGFGPVLLNMGVLGFLSSAVVLICRAPLNGPVIGGIFTVVGFGAFGKHLRNTIPVMLGVLLGYSLTGVPLDTTGAMVTLMFSTTLAPIAGTFGLGAGVVAGLLHMALVSNTSYLHGGMNLYNNGFTGGFVAAVLANLLQEFKKKI